MRILYPVILSGGAGTRLWPLSREDYPKQFLSLVDDSTLLKTTASRCYGLSGTGAPLLVCNQSHRFIVAEQMRKLGLQPTEIMLEPCGRSTAPALTMAALALTQQDPEALMLVMPADHVIQDLPAFHQTVQQARPLAKIGRIVAFGVVPTRPETGYGYIRQGPGQEIAEFVEKPSQETAMAYLASGQYLWNSGIFLLAVATWLEEMASLQPEMLRCCQAAFDQGHREHDFFWIAEAPFQLCPKDSIDYAIMEKTAQASVLPLNLEWSDVGSWDAVWQISRSDADGNVIQGDVYSLNTRNSLINAQSRFLAVLGVEDLIILETADAVLVAHREQAQAIGDVVRYLKSQSRGEI